MDYDKLIERLRKEAYGSDIEELLLEAATAIETLRAENERLWEQVRQLETRARTERCDAASNDAPALCGPAEVVPAWAVTVGGRPALYLSRRELADAVQAIIDLDVELREGCRDDHS